MKAKLVQDQWVVNNSEARISDNSSGNNPHELSFAYRFNNVNIAEFNIGTYGDQVENISPQEEF